MYYVIYQLRQLQRLSIYFLNIYVQQCDTYLGIRNCLAPYLEKKLNTT